MPCHCSIAPPSRIAPPPLVSGISLFFSFLSFSLTVTHCDLG
uniref:Uncharacterized protein n=1 Tax=Fagus sylvatica TaxID=28930 RepID=A0A2N9F6Z2_FAGSY